MDGLGTTQPKSPGLRIQLEFCERAGITLAEMKSESRKRRFAQPRQAAMVEIRRQLGYSYPQIGRMFNKDHTTVLHACRKFGMEPDPVIRTRALRGVEKRRMSACLMAEAS